MFVLVAGTMFGTIFVGTTTMHGAVTRGPSIETGTRTVVTETFLHAGTF